MGTTVRDALLAYLNEKTIRDSSWPPERLYEDDWFRVYAGGRRLRVLKLGGAIGSVVLHDTHHLLTGYGTDMRGEAELTGWELGSGGCGRHWVMWIDRILAIPTLMLFYPRASLRALRCGRRGRNLYRVGVEEVLGMELDELRRRVGANEATLP